MRFALSLCRLDAGHLRARAHDRKVRARRYGGEYRLLLAFVSHPNRVLSRHQLIELTRTRRSELFDRSIDVRVSRLRQLLRDHRVHRTSSKTVYGDGYVLGATVRLNE